MTPKTGPKGCRADGVQRNASMSEKQLSMSLRRSDQWAPGREDESSKLEDFLSAYDGKGNGESQHKMVSETVYTNSISCMT